VTVIKSTDKNKDKIAAMFNDIAGSYDFLNHFLPVNIDKLRRKKAVRMLSNYKPKYILDVATGTADFAVSLTKLKPVKITGIDIAEEMLEIGRKKIKKLKLSNTIELIKGDALSLPFKPGSFDAVTVAFGIRNFENLDKGIEQIYNALRKDGSFLILEFSKTKKNPVGMAFKFYFKYILPFLGKFFSKNKSAYKYLFDSVESFPETNILIQKLKSHGFVKVITKRLSMGIATIYIALK
jgi:demethylmenaquinone methyltransferase / 2-methoxy-6-polyprenyl-1,4-benzoquinol methylase